MKTVPHQAANCCKLLTSVEMGTNRIHKIVKSLRNFSRCDESEIKEVDVQAGSDSTLMIFRLSFKDQTRTSKN